MAEQASAQRKIDRSPRYPAIDLEAALRRITAIYRREGKHVVPNEVAARHWELSPKSSTVLTTMAALRGYGLLADGRSAGTAGVLLTDLGLKLAADERGVNPERKRLLQEAALKPPAYAAIWKHYGGSLPSDDLMEYHLKAERGFTQEGARAFIRNFRSTLRFAEVDQPATIAVDEEAPEAEEKRPEAQGPLIAPPPSKQGPGVQIPIARGEWATIVGPFPMPKAKWRKFMEMLKTMEFALVEEEGSGVTPELSEPEPSDEPS